MKSVLEELYMGNIRPDSRMYDKDSPFVQAANLKQRNLNSMMKMLDDSGKEVFEKYCDAQSDIEEISRYDLFTYALKFDVLLMAEIFMNSSEVVGEVMEL
jgi:hypothetical protein